MKTLVSLLAGLLAVLAFAANAQAQFAGASGGNIELYADDAVSAKGVTTLTGQVDARQDDVRILADKMVIYSKQNANGNGPAVGSVAGDIERIVATGNFYYITPEQEVRGDQGIYTAADDIFEVTGDVILVQDDSVVRGTRLIYELETQRARVISECQGRKCGRQGRVAILIKNTPEATETTAGTS